MSVCQLMLDDVAASCTLCEGVGTNLMIATAVGGNVLTDGISGTPMCCVLLPSRPQVVMSACWLQTGTCASSRQAYHQKQLLVSGMLCCMRVPK